MNIHRRVPWIRFAAIALTLFPAGCRRDVSALLKPRSSAVAFSGGTNRSMIYLARVDSGVVAIDLGWWGSTRAVRRALADIGASPAAVTHVFLTHSHRDHIGAWRLVRGSTFHLAAREKPAFFGSERHEGFLPREAERLRPTDLPEEGEIAVRTFSRDTAFVFGADTLRAFLVPGHTAGSAVYLFRGILFLGDAVGYMPIGGFRPALSMFSNDADRARASLASLWERLPESGVTHACTAHAECAPFSKALVEEIQR